MTQQWQLSGNAESVDWSDLAMAGRAYADNLVGEPSVSKVMHMMADEIERLRSAVRPQPYAKNDEKRVLYDTKSPRNGALSGCETVPDPDSRVWDTPCTPQPHATPTQGSVQDDGSVRVSRNANEPVAWMGRAARTDGGDFTVLRLDRKHAESDVREEAETCEPREIVPLYRHPQPALADEEIVSLQAEVARLKATSAKLWDIAASSIDPPERRRMLDRLGMDSFSEDG